MSWLVALAIGFAFAQSQDEAAFKAAAALLSDRYPAATDDLYRAAIDGMARQVDTLAQTEGSGLLTDAQYQQVLASLRGERRGIGLQVWVQAGQGLLVSRVFEGSPAEKQGLKQGDFVVGINDTPLTGMTAAAMLNLLEYARPPRIVLDVRRAGDAARTYSVPMGTYFASAVSPCSQQGWSCLELQHFGVGTADALRAALEDLDPNRGLVLDLRMTDSGAIDEMVAAAGLFLDAGAVVVSRGLPGKASEPLPARGGPVWPGKVVLLVDNGTGGLAEAFAAALRESGRATLVGTRTAGRATTDTYYPLGQGLVLRLADVHLRSPAGRDWAAQGLIPDLTVEHPRLVLRVDQQAAPPDLQLEAAIRLIRGP